MKKILYICFIFSLFVACDDLPEFDDYDFNAVYFPIQYQVRTINLGNDFWDNSDEQAGKIQIGVTLAGMYNNDRDREVSVVVDNSMVKNIVTDKGDTIYAMPESYYTLGNENKIIIAKDEEFGMLDVQLSEAFFADPLAVANHYVIPLRITDADADSVLSGSPAPGVSNPERLIDSDWESNKQPKDFTLCCVKFINDMDGDFLFKGLDVLTYDGYSLDSINDEKHYTINYPVVTTKTSSFNSVTTNFVSYLSSDVGDYKMKLTLNADSTVTIDSIAGSLYMPFVHEKDAVSSFKQNAEEWGGKKRDAMYLNYSYYDGLVLHRVMDTLIFRNRNITFETFNPVVY